MEKLNKSQMLKLLVIASLLMTTPLLSTPHRPKFLYFILNILILVVGAESGLLSFFLDSSGNKKLIDDHHDQIIESSIISADANCRVVESRCSAPSIFFIEGTGEEEEDASCLNEETEKDEEVGEELFEKAEMFIGNFYKQLKMQREESWKKLHDIYQKAF